MFKLIISSAIAFSLNSPFVETSSRIEAPSFTYTNAAQMKELTRPTHCFFWLPKAELDTVKRHTFPHKPQHNPKDTRR